MTRIPANIADFTPELLGELLSRKHPGANIDRFEIVEHARCGDGLASTADRVALKLCHGPGGHSNALPERLILKTILLNPALKFGMPVVLGTAKAVQTVEKIPLLRRLATPALFTLINWYQRLFPHAPEAMYRNEVNFYDRLRPELPIEAPCCYASAIDERNGQFVVLMEDLRLRRARFPNALDGVSVAEMRSLVRNLARLHAHFWNSPRLEGDLAWLPTTHARGMYPVFAAIGLNLIRDQVAKCAFKRTLIAPLNRCVDSLWAATWSSQKIIYRQPHTLLHGDTHIGNTYVLPDGSGGLLDWQLMVRGPWCHDLTYLMVTGLSIDDRRRHEREILALYLESLAQYGVSEVPDLDEAYALYAQSAIWGLVIGWLITPPQNYGEAITAANVQKTVTAMLDLDTLARLEA